MNGYSIVLVGLEDARCIVVGGGQVAARKVASLREAGVSPVVISPVLCQALQCEAAGGTLEVIQREYRHGDLAGARLVIAATDDPETNEAVWREGSDLGCLVNVVDDPQRCNFYVPASVRRGALTISISTAGQSPALARRLRETLEREFDSSYEPFLALLGELRPQVMGRLADPAGRKLVWQAILDSEILDLFRRGAHEAARQRALEIVDRIADTCSTDR